MKREIIILFIFILSFNGLVAQEMTIDTTDAQYQLGKEIGSWLPVTIILVVAILFIRHTYKFRDQQGNID